MNNKLFKLFVASVAMAACTSDEELVVSTGDNVQLANRPSLGVVEFTPGEQTRAVVDKGWGHLGYVKSDAIGAALVDELNTSAGNKNPNSNTCDQSWSYAEYVKDVTKRIWKNNSPYWGQWKAFNEISGNDPAVFYNVNSAAINTNYGYTYNGESWTSEASLVEGHYMFYFPYNKNNANRLPVVAEVPQDQDCTKDTSAVWDLYQGTTPVAVDLKFLRKPVAGQKISATATPQPIFALPKFTIVNNFNGYVFNMVRNTLGTGVDQDESARTGITKVQKTITIDRIELVYTGAGTKLWYKAPINPSKLKGMVNAGWETNKFKTPNCTSDIMGDGTYNIEERTTGWAYQTPYSNKASNIANGNTQMLVLNINRTLNYGDSYSFNAVMPAEDYSDALKARIYVTIDGRHYIMMKTDDNSFTKIDYSNNAYHRVECTGNVELFAFDTYPVQLVRGERYPITEYIVDGTTATAKTSAGKTLTINLNGLSAFESGNFTSESNESVFTTKEEFINHMKNAIRGTELTEVQGQTSLAEHEVAFKDRNFTIDADLVEAIYNNVVLKKADGSENIAMLLNYKNLNIGTDVEVEKNTSETKVGYTIYNLKARGYTIKVAYKNGVVNTNGSALESGINDISEGSTLAAGTISGSSKFTNGFVFLNCKVESETATAQTYTIENGADSFRFVVTSKTVGTGESAVTTKCNLNVGGAQNKNCGARITGKMGTVTITGNQTNSASDFTGAETIVNNGLKTIAGKTTGKTVSATLAGWPAEVSTSTKVNNVTINPANSTALSTEQANVDAFKIGGTVITLGENVASLISVNNVNLTTTNIKQLKGTNSISWTGSSAGPMVVTAYKANDRGRAIQITNISAPSNSNCTINMVD